MRKILLYFAGCIIYNINYAAQLDTAYQASSLTFLEKQVVDCDTLSRFTWKHAVAPVVVVGMTAIQCTPWMININHTVKNKVVQLDFHTKLDDYLQYAPAAAVLVFDVAGIQGRHRILDKIIILAMASVMEVALVNGIKYSIGTLRPDGSAHNSFPSGHTATAFMGATFLHNEYGYKSVWYSIGGYAAATLTGYMRIQNNRHWLSDVIAGAAVGIFSTQTAYLLHPYLHKAIFPKKNKYVVMLMPYYTPQQTGVGATIVF
jgi:membrane-associated phospholipid phosphatase